MNIFQKISTNLHLIQIAISSAKQFLQVVFPSTFPVGRWQMTDDDGLIFASVIVGIPYPERIPDGFVTDDRSNLLFLFFLKGQVKKQQRRHILWYVACCFKLWPGRDSNPRPSEPESDALFTKLPSQLQRKSIYNSDANQILRPKSSDETLFSEPSHHLLFCFIYLLKVCQNAIN